MTVNEFVVLLLTSVQMEKCPIIQNNGMQYVEIIMLTSLNIIGGLVCKEVLKILKKKWNAYLVQYLNLFSNFL